MKLSILVPTTPRRVDSYFPRIILELTSQAERELQHGTEVEILGFYDNKRMSVGAKRNRLMDISRGEYLAFVDDDDEVNPAYLMHICDALNKNPGVDVACFKSLVTTDLCPSPKPCHYGLELEYAETSELWTGKPAHTMVWKSSIAKQGRFPDTKLGEDTDWVAQVVQLAKTEVQIDHFLYQYNFRASVSETRT